MKKNEIEFARAVLALEAVGGPHWETFLRHFRQYRDACVRDLLASGPDTVMSNQGRARGAQEMVSCIESARDTAAKS